MSDPSPGWYPDPSGAPQDRWWDGTQWTSAIVPAANPEPIPLGAVRPEGPGDAPPGTVLFDEKIVGVGVYSRQLKVTPEQITWGRETVTLDRIRGIAYWTTSTVPAGTERFFVLHTPAAAWEVPLHSTKLGASKRNNEEHYLRLVEIAEHLIEPRLCEKALSLIAAGGEYNVGHLTLDRIGLRSATRVGTVSMPWSHVAGARAADGVVVIDGSDGGHPITISTELTNAMVVARLVPVAVAHFG